MVNIINGLASKISAAHGNIFYGILQRSQLIVKLALAERVDKDMARIEDKYDGSKEDKIEAKIAVEVDKKFKSADMLKNVNNAVKKLNDVRLILFEMRVAADSVDTATFDTKMDALNGEVVFEQPSEPAHTLSPRGTLDGERLDRLVGEGGNEGFGAGFKGIGGTGLLAGWRYKYQTHEADGEAASKRHRHFDRETSKPSFVLGSGEVSPSPGAGMLPEDLPSLISSLRR